MRDLIWVFSIVLALIFLITGVSRALRYQQTRKFFAWVNDVPRPLVQVIGFVEILGALGLILPVATGIYPWLTLVAAGALALLLILAILFHAQRHEGSEIGAPVLLLLMIAFVAYGRWTLGQVM